MSNRPDWCPADVWTTAVFASGPAEPFYSPHATRIVVARAILAERERCVKAVKESMMLHYMSIGTGNSAIAKIMGAEE